MASAGTIEVQVTVSDGVVYALVDALAAANELAEYCGERFDEDWPEGVRLLAKFEAAKDTAAVAVEKWARRP